MEPTHGRHGRTPPPPPGTQQQPSPQQRLNDYASKAISAIEEAFLTEHLHCKKNDIHATSTSITTLNGRNPTLNIRPGALFQKADTSGIDKLKGDKRELFDLLVQRCDGLMPLQTAESVILTEAVGTNTDVHQIALQDTHLLKRSVLETVLKVSQKDASSIVEGIKGM